MSSAARSYHARQAGHYLHELLLEPYRDRWARPDYATRTRAGEVSQAAVAQVLAQHLWHHPRQAKDRDVLPVALKDLVSRALAGKVLSRQTLQLFIDALHIDTSDAEVLWCQWEGQELARVIIGDLPRLDGTTTNTPTYQTVSLHEFHYIDADGRPLKHRTVQAIRALVDGVSSHRYSYDTNEAMVERVHGGVPGQPYQRQGSIWAVDLALPRTLKRGEATSLMYDTIFHYSGHVEPVFRRVAHQRLEDVMIRVEFHPERPPAHVWWAEWADYREPNNRIIHKELVSLDSEHAVCHRLDVLDQAVVGFWWEFAER